MRVTLNLSSRAAELLLRLQPGGRSRVVSDLIVDKFAPPAAARLVKKEGRMVGEGALPTSTAEVRKFIHEWP